MKEFIRKAKVQAMYFDGENITQEFEDWVHSHKAKVSFEDGMLEISIQGGHMCPVEVEEPCWIVYDSAIGYDRALDSPEPDLSSWLVYYDEAFSETFVSVQEFQSKDVIANDPFAKTLVQELGKPYIIINGRDYDMEKYGLKEGSPISFEDIVRIGEINKGFADPSNLDQITMSCKSAMDNVLEEEVVLRPGDSVPLVNQMIFWGTGSVPVPITKEDFPDDPDSFDNVQLGGD
jgi:hypothetical protein